MPTTLVFKRLIYVTIFFFYLGIVSAKLIISEIIYNPPGADENHEWLEIYNGNETINISNYRLIENGVNHLIAAINKSYILNNSYAVIAEDWQTFLSDYPNFSGTVFDSTFSLSNTGEELALKNTITNEIEDNTTYLTIYANGNGNSISRVNNSWLESIPTPGEINKLLELCDWKISVSSEKDIFDSDFEFKVVIEKIFGNKINLTILRSIEDELGKIAKSYDPLKRNYSETKTRETITYTPNLKPGPYIVNASIVNLSCHDINLDDNHDSRLFFILGEETSEEKKESYVKIDDIYDLGKDEKAEFGQIIRVKISIYKGDTRKSSVKLWVGDGKNKISKEASLKIEDKFQNLELVLPLPLDPNCDKKLKDSVYRIYLEGLDDKDNEKIEIEGINKELCKEEKINEREISKKEISGVDKDYQQAKKEIKPKNTTIIKEKTVKEEIIYESKNYKIMKLVPIFIIVLTTVLSVLLIWKR